MKRKIVKLGEATLVISLPSKWAKKFNLKQGNELEVLERERDLIITTENEYNIKEKTIDISNLDTKLVNAYLISAYINGYDTIKLSFSKDEIKDLKSKKNLKLIPFIQDIVNKYLIGMEVIELKSSSCIIKDLSRINEGEFDNTIRRIFLMIISLSEDCLNNIKENKTEITTISHSKDNIKRFINYCLRILNKRNYKEPNKVFLYDHIIKELSFISSIYGYIAEENIKRKTKASNDFIEAFTETNNSFKLFYELFYKFSQEKALEIVSSRRKFFDIINEYQYENKKCDKFDLILSGRLTIIVLLILQLTETKMGMELVS